ncbi:hypothetical protein KIW84_052826 [Lathyrus oleraceus]|uniref:Uncharacterized protein n=1 Tax=Pisum sativum TaxID=3888 RepID=A0A9D4WRE7_PEA|nr:hypothetical protein KIW84_052826 [Pisum sativum]
MFSVVFHHGGEFVSEKTMFYKGGVQSTVHGQNIGKWGISEDHHVIDVATYVVGNSIEGHLYVEHNVKDIKVKMVEPQCIDVIFYE